MLNERLEAPDRPGRLRMIDPTLTARLRLFGLLALLVPLFAGLQYVVREGVPRVEVRLVAQDVQTTVPVEVPVERVVERVVYVPVGSQMPVPPTEATEPARAIVPAAPAPTGEADVQIGGVPTTDVPARAPEPAPPVVVAEPLSETPPLTGTVALAPPPVPAAPAVTAGRVPIAPGPSPAEEVVAEETEEEVVAEAEAPAPEVVAEAEAPAPEVVAEAEPEAVEEVRVIQFVSEQPVVREDAGASISMLRHELYVRETRPVPAPEEEIVEALPDFTPEEGPMPAADGEPATEPEAAAAEQEAEEPVADEAPVSEVTAVSSEELLAQAPSTTVEMLDQGADNEQALGVLEHTLVARTVPAKAEPKQEEKEAEAEAEGPPVAVTPEDEGPGEVAKADQGDDADEAPVADADAGRPEVARTDEQPTDGEGGEQ